jgi:hypothetical protein
LVGKKLPTILRHGIGNLKVYQVDIHKRYAYCTSIPFFFFTLLKIITMYGKHATMLTVIAFATVTTIAAQKNNSAFVEFGAGAGTIIYQGDLASSVLGATNTANVSWQFYVQKTLNSSFAVRANLAVGTIRVNESDYATPAWKQQRNFNFSTRLTEVSAQLLFSPFGTNIGRYTPKFTPYAFAGVAATFTDVERDYSRTTASFLSDTKFSNGFAFDSARGTPKVIAAIPVGVGVRYAFSGAISAYAEATYRVTASDYIDGFSRSANPLNKDQYYGANIGIHVKLFSKRTGCPPVKW